MHGLLLIDKPEGITSADVVRRVKRRIRVKTGHLGTLDPFASGLLPICLGEGTKLAPFLNQDDKAYTGRIRLGCRTDTGDRTGAVVERSPVSGPFAAAHLASVAAEFWGERLQVPPMYSAIKRDGRPLYALARQGITVERAPRRIVIHRFEIAPGPDDTALDFEVSCSKGTYVRVLAEEVAGKLGTVGHLEVLRRTRFGDLSIDDAQELSKWEAGEEARLIPLSAALGAIPVLRLDSREVDRARQGSAALLAGLPVTQGETLQLLDPDGRLVAVLARQDDEWSYARVFAPV